MKYFLLPLGCQMNRSDTERVRTVLHGMGFTETDKEEEATILGVIACSVRQKGIDKVYTRILRWNEMKQNHNCITFVSGCILPADRERFVKLFDLVFTMNELPDLPDMIRQYGVFIPTRDNVEQEPVFPLVGIPVNRNVNPSANMDRFWVINPDHLSDFEAFIPIQNGCNKFCTYCAVPYTRGREVSRKSEDILAELKELVDKGYKSITLLGQNVNSYGLDKKGEEINFAELLRRIGAYGDASGKEFWVYFTSPHPRDMSDEVIEVISQYRCLGKQIHLPIQSGDDNMLQRMNRKHTLDDYRHIIHTIRRLLPEATIFTDIIVGFTGETEEEFENSRKAMEEFKYNMAYIAQYSVRPGAVASSWADDVPKAKKRERYHILTDELMKHSLVYNQGLIGKTLKVLVSGYDRKNGYLTGHTEGKIVIRFQSRDKSLIGQIVNVKVTSATALSIEGTLQPVISSETK
ncbi:MAG: tRNA (N6-isopentenyl adenosine(37)-C2)-methylthiotransferase MiaB [Bacteroidales bacterium]|jgi:tRNA-N(6)-(isopentenyl)adenosine-37 thiotransferase enzyme MiaB|nr:tRNA (N6-isopentenyl adenosine(37)-C2)-methylthiotransferase MiaB [Bacteroidales bacterium]